MWTKCGENARNNDTRSAFDSKQIWAYRQNLLGFKNKEIKASCDLPFTGARASNADSPLCSFSPEASNPTSEIRDKSTSSVMQLCSIVGIVTRNNRMKNLLRRAFSVMRLLPGQQAEINTEYEYLHRNGADVVDTDRCDFL